MAFYRKLGSGWEYRITYRDSQGKKREKSKRGFKTKTLAKVAAQQAEIDLNTLTADLLDITVLDYNRRWADIYKRPHITAKTWQNTPKILSTSNIILGLGSSRVSHTPFISKSLMTLAQK